MTKLLSFSAKLPEITLNRIAELARLLGHSQNRVLMGFMEMSLKMVYEPDHGGFPRIVNIARAVLHEEKIQKVSGVKSPLGTRFAAMNIDGIPPLLKARLQRIALNGAQICAIRHLLVSHRMTRREYEALTQTLPTTAKRQLAELARAGVLLKRGKSRNSWYELKNEAKKPGQ